MTAYEHIRMCEMMDLCAEGKATIEQERIGRELWAKYETENEIDDRITQADRGQDI